MRKSHKYEGGIIFMPITNGSSKVYPLSLIKYSDILDGVEYVYAGECSHIYSCGYIMSLHDIYSKQFLYTYLHVYKIHMYEYTMLLFSASDPNQFLISIQWTSRSGSVFRIRIKIRIKILKKIHTKNYIRA